MVHWELVLNRLIRHGRTGGVEEVWPSTQRLADTCENSQKAVLLLQQAEFLSMSSSSAKRLS